MWTARQLVEFNMQGKKADEKFEMKMDFWVFKN